MAWAGWVLMRSKQVFDKIDLLKSALLKCGWGVKCLFGLFKASRMQRSER